MLTESASKETTDDVYFYHMRSKNEQQWLQISDEFIVVVWLAVM